MKQIILISIFFMAYSIRTMAQESQTSQPSVKVTFKTPQKVSPIIKYLREMALDDSTIEKVVRELNIRGYQQIKEVISDEQFQTLNHSQRWAYVRKTEVLEIIQKIQK
jgi:predicted RNA-binding protein with PIN domain